LHDAKSVETCKIKQAVRKISDLLRPLNNAVVATVEQSVRILSHGLEQRLENGSKQRTVG